MPHASSNQSWVESANDPACDFPLQNLPYGVFRSAGEDRVGIAIGTQILDLHACAEQSLLRELPPSLLQVCQAPNLNPLMAQGPAAASLLRAELTRLLSSHASREERAQLQPLLTPIAQTELKLPVAIGDYTDFYASLHHATNVGRLFRPDHPLLPNYKHLPIGYHGRASSIILSGEPIHRPSGQRKSPTQSNPDFGPTHALDYECELGVFIGQGNFLGHPIPIAQAEQHLFGLCLVNDWSARDLQSWEYQPLGPFLGKNFATTISPWVIPFAALAPFRTRSTPRAAEDPPLLAHLQPGENGGLDITFEVHLATPRMRHAGIAPHLLSRANSTGLYWTLAQMVAHHTSNGCNLRTGDLLATGTISGPTPGSLGCLLELTRNGTAPITLPSGETRTYLEAGDEVTLRAFCERPGQARIGFGACTGIISASTQFPT